MNDIPRKKGVIFDLDGTLWNTSERIVPAWNEVLARRGLRQITTEDMNSYMGKTPDGIVSMMLPDLPREEGLAVFADCLTAEDDFLRRHGGILYPALEETLAVLRETYFSALSAIATRPTSTTSSISTGCGSTSTTAKPSEAPVCPRRKTSGC